MPTPSNSDLDGVKVCVVAPFPPPLGGMSIQASRLVSYLASEKVEVVAVNGYPRLPKAVSFFSRIPVLRTLCREVIYICDLATALPDSEVIHHLAASGVSFFLQSAPLLLLGSLLRKRVILNYRGGDAQRFFHRWHRLVVPLLRMADEVAVPSEYLKRIFAEYGFKASFLPNLADTARFEYRERQSYGPRLIVTRHLEPIYDIECVIRAFAIVQERFLDAALAIVGTGRQEQDLKKMVAEGELRNVTFYGLVSPEKLPGLYGQYDICVNASKVDNFPGALVEAACSGLPIVTTAAGGIPDMIHHRETGILVDVGDSAALAQAVVDLVERQQFARQLVHAARAWSKQYSWDRVFPRLISLYRPASAEEENSRTQLAYGAGDHE